MTGAGHQLRALLALRWQMVRAPGGKLVLVLALLAVGWLLVLVTSTGDSLEPAALETAVELAPQAFFGFAVLALIAPLTAGGGNEVVPPDHLVAFPVRPRTQFLGGLALAPLNLVWALNLLVLSALTSYLTLSTSFVRGAITTASYVGCLTILGQALAWLVVGLRQTRGGRRTVTGAAVLAFAAAVVAVRSGSTSDLLDASPTRSVVTAVASTDDQLLRWGATTAALLGLAVLSLWLGSRACAWALRRPGDAGSMGGTGPVRRRRAQRTPLRELVAVDRASAWRAPALRRGGLVLAVLPGVLAAGAQVPWQSLVVLPGLVAAGAGLLFGINAFSLDASGATWVASLPHRPRMVATAKVLVLTETVLGAVLIAAVAGSLRSPGAPTATQLTAILSSALACTAIVVATAMSSSVRHPHHAELRGPRDAVAPPGALVLASMRLAVPAASIGIVLESVSRLGVAWVPPLVALPVLALAGLSLQRTLAQYDVPARRARVVAVVSAG